MINLEKGLLMRVFCVPFRLKNNKFIK